MAKKKERNLSDQARVIRKRFEDEAKRYRRAAEKLPDERKAEARYFEQAAVAAERNAEKYKMKNLREEFGRGQEANARIANFLGTVGESESRAGMASTLRDTNAREEQLARRVLSTRSGSRFYAGTVAIWRNKPVNERNQAILDFFGMDNLWQVIQHFEENLGIDFFDLAEQQAVVHRTSTEALRIQEFVVLEMKRG